jgi:hypothetical protein
VTENIELIELSPPPGDGAEEMLAAPRGQLVPHWWPVGRCAWPAPSWQPPSRRWFGAASVCAVVLAVAVAVLVSHPSGSPGVPAAAPSASAPSTWPEGAPSPIPRAWHLDPRHAYTPLDPLVLAALRAQVCSGGSSCSFLPDSQRGLAQYLWMFPDSGEVSGGILVGPGGVTLGRGATVTLDSGVQYSLTVVRAHGPPLARETTSRRTDGGMVTLTARRGSWDLISTVTFQGVVFVPMGPARTWLASSALPDGRVAGPGAPA